MSVNGKTYLFSLLILFMLHFQVQRLHLV